MKKNRFIIALITASMTALLCSYASAGVTQEEADRLKKDLTPIGAERAGNADGTIPEWTGGLQELPAGITHKQGEFFPDPFADDKVLFTITAANMDQYKDKLNPGTMAMLKRYPDTNRLDVYQTRRSVGYREWNYENTYKNATRAKLTEDGNGFTGAFGGYPFPIPSKGLHLVHNHRVRYGGAASKTPGFDGGVVSASGELTVGGGGYYRSQTPYYEKGKSYEEWLAEGGISKEILMVFDRPPRRKGELTCSVSFMNLSEKDVQVYQYLPGQRRVRRAPNMLYDAPQSSTSGYTTADDNYMFSGKPDRFDWKIVGKQEMYIPYNCYKFQQQGKRDELLNAGHINPDYLRWELHRVWILEATLKEGARHVYGKRIFFIDEDSWTIILKDQYDKRGELWITGMTVPCYDYTTRCHFAGSAQNIHYDMTRKEYSAQGLLNNFDSRPVLYPETLIEPHEKFTPSHLRKLGRR